MYRKSFIWGFVMSLFIIPFIRGEALAQGRGGYEGCPMGLGMMGQWGMGWFGMIFMLIFWVLVIASLILLIRWLIQKTRREAGPAHGGSRAIDILKEHYARGEIDKEEFEEKKRDLLR